MAATMLQLQSPTTVATATVLGGTSRFGAPEEVPSPLTLSDYPLVDLLADLQEAEDLGAVAVLLLGEEDPLEEGKSRQSRKRRTSWTPWRRTPRRRICTSGGAAGGGGNNKLVGNPPEIFDGDRIKVKGFLLSWNIYRGLNWSADVMDTPFTRTMLFFSYIKGPTVNEWVAAQADGLWTKSSTELNVADEYLWVTIYDRFKDAFTDTMSEQHAEKDIKDIRMQGGEIDQYIAKFETLARLAGMGLDEKGTIKLFTDGLPQTFTAVSSIRKLVPLVPGRNGRTPPYASSRNGSISERFLG